MAMMMRSSSGATPSRWPDSQQQQQQQPPPPPADAGSSSTSRMGSYEKALWDKKRDQDLEREHREREIRIGIMLAGVVDVAAEDIMTPMRDMVRIIVRVVVKGMGGQLMNGRGDYFVVLPLAISFDRSFFLSIVQCTYFLEICFHHFK